MDYVARHQIDPDALDEPTLMRILDDLQLLDPLQQRVQQERQEISSITNGVHTLTVTISKGRKFRPLLELARPAQFYFTLSAFGQKARSSTYEVA